MTCCAFYAKALRELCYSRVREASQTSLYLSILIKSRYSRVLPVSSSRIAPAKSPSASPPSRRLLQAHSCSWRNSFARAIPRMGLASVVALMVKSGIKVGSIHCACSAFCSSVVRRSNSDRVASSSASALGRVLLILRLRHFRTFFRYCRVTSRLRWSSARFCSPSASAWVRRWRFILRVVFWGKAVSSLKRAVRCLGASTRSSGCARGASPRMTRHARSVASESMELIPPGRGRR